MRRRHRHGHRRQRHAVRATTGDVRTAAGVAGRASRCTFTDPGTLDTHTATVDWGDGAGPVGLGAVTSPFTLPARSLRTGTSPPQVCVTDDDGAAAAPRRSSSPAPTSHPTPSTTRSPVAAGSSANRSTSSATTPTPTAIRSRSSPRRAVRRWHRGLQRDLVHVHAGARLRRHRDVHVHRRRRHQRRGHGDGHGDGDRAEQPTRRRARPVPATGVAPLVVTAAIAGSDPDADTLEATLDWGDGTAPVGGPLPLATAPTHTYATPGTYVARLAVSDGEATTSSRLSCERRRASRSRPPPATTRSSPAATTVQPRRLGLAPDPSASTRTAGSCATRDGRRRRRRATASSSSGRRSSPAPTAPS